MRTTRACETSVAVVGDRHARPHTPVHTLWQLRKRGRVCVRARAGRRSIRRQHASAAGAVGRADGGGGGGGSGGGSNGRAPATRQPLCCCSSPSRPCALQLYTAEPASQPARPPVSMSPISTVVHPPLASWRRLRARVRPSVHRPPPPPSSRARARARAYRRAAAAAPTGQLQQQHRQAAAISHRRRSRIIGTQCPSGRRTRPRRRRYSRRPRVYPATRSSLPACS